MNGPPWSRRDFAKAAALGAVLPALLAVAALAVPAARTLTWNVSHLRPGTRELARNWIETNVPEGAAILTETQAPRLDESRYLVHHRRFAALDSLDDIRDPLWDYLILARPAYGLFLDPSNWREPHHEEMARRYREMLDFELAAEFAPGPWRSGPRLKILEVDPEQTVYRTHRVFAAADAVWLSTPDLKRDGPNGSIRFRRRWHYAAFKDHFAAGRYRVAWGSRPNPPLGGWLYVVGRDGREVGTFEIVPELTLELPSPGKYFLRVFLPPRSMLHGLELERVEPAG